MKLVVLDGFTLNPGDLSWDPLHSLADCTIFDRTTEAEVLTRGHDAELLLTNKTPLRAATLASLPALRYIGVLATGYDVVDVNEAARRNIVVTNVPEYGTSSVSQMVFALLFELCHRVGLHSEAVRTGAWTQSKDWSFSLAPNIELAGKTLGIVGFGRIGRRVAEIALAMEMQVSVTSTKTPAQLPSGVRWLPLDELLAHSDVVSLHCPLRPSTRGLIDERRLRQMKPGAFLINTARGSLIVEADLADALNSGRLAGAAVDVLSTEPPSGSNPLLSARNCIITPHMAWATREARSRLLATAIENVRCWLAGCSQNVIPGSAVPKSDCTRNTPS